MDRAKLIESIRQHEGFSGVPYPDTQGKVTIGYGRNLTDNPLTPAEGAYLMTPQVEAAILNAPALVKNWKDLNDTRQAVLAEMVYNIGFYGVLNFKMTRAAIERGDFVEAAREMRDSLWAKQVGKRAERLANRMATGEWV